MSEAGARPAGAVAAELREIAAYLRLDGDRFRSLAYEKAARSVEGVHDLDRLIADRRLTELPAVGRSLAGVIEDLALRRSVGVLDRLRARWPRALAELATLPRMDAARARALYDALAPGSLDEVAALCEAGRVRSVPGFGKVSEARLLNAIRSRHERGSVLLLDDARQLGASLARFVRGLPSVAAAEPAGPPRRWMEVADHVALAVASTAPGVVADRLRAHAMIASVEERGGDAGGFSLVVRLVNGVRCEVYFAAPARFGVALVRATGSAAHVAALERHALDRGTTLDRVAAPDEAALYAALGLPLLPPEVRDGSDEIAAALHGDDFSDLVAREDVQGAVHCHTTYSDGKSTIAAMAAAAAALGLSYLTITDHSQSAGYAGGLDPTRLREQWDEIARVQPTTPVRLLRGTESDILVDGALDYPMPLLGDLDVVIASIHKRHKLDEDGMTRRLVAAIRQPVFKVWGHALGRILLHREPIACRFDEVLDALAESAVAVEINGDPRRLDLEPSLARRARDRGVPFVLSSDAHSTAQLGHIENAVGLARRARIRRSEVLNALSPEEFARAVRPGR
jgi:DNA polymerase (family 10)